MLTYNFPVSDPGRIAINAAIIGERPTGLGLYALNVIRALDALGEQLLVYTSRPDLIAGRHTRVEPISSAVRPERGARGHVARLLWTQTGLRRLVRHARPALLLNLMPEGLLWPTLPQVTTVLDALPLLYPAEYPRQQYYFRHYVPAVLRFSKRVIVISEATKRDVLRFYGLPSEKLHVVPPGYDVDRFNPDGPRAIGDYALYVGNVMPHKNLLRLVEAFGETARGHRLRLLIRGWGRDVHVRALKAKIATLGLEPRVDWQPYAPADELPALYRAARMLLLPSLYEGFGLTALEAMACGTPVITSNTSSLPEVVGDAALIVKPEDSAAIAQAIARIASDEALAKDLGARGIARARLFSWGKTGHGIRAAIRDASVPA